SRRNFRRERTADGLLDLNKVAIHRADAGRCGMLRSSPGVEDRNLVHAGNGAMGCAEFFGQVLATYVITGVFRERDRRIAALLRTVMDQTVFADIEVARARAAAPIIGQALGNVVLE